MNELRNWSNRNDNDAILNLVDSILERMNKYRMDHGINGYNTFIWGYHLDIKKVVNFSKRLQLKANTFLKAKESMVNHTHYLQNKLMEYQQSLDKDKSSICLNKAFKIKEKRWSKSSSKPIKISFKHMLHQNVIIDNNDDDFSIKINNHIVFHFFHQSLDCFKLQIKSKSKSKKQDNSLNNVISDKLLTLSLVKLLEMKIKIIHNLIYNHLHLMLMVQLIY